MSTIKKIMLFNNPWICSLWNIIVLFNRQCRNKSQLTAGYIIIVVGEFISFDLCLSLWEDNIFHNFIVFCFSILLDLECVICCKNDYHIFPSSLELYD